MQRVVRSTLVGLLTLAGLTACGDKVTVPPPTSNAPGTVVHSVTVSPNSLNLKVGDKVTLAASVDADAGVTDRTVTWSSSNTAIATVDATGLVTAVSGGNATIIAKSKADPNVSGAAAVSVAANVPASVTLGQINQTVCDVFGGCTSVPATLNNVANQLDVTLNVDPGTQTLAGVDLIMNCGGADTVVASQNLASAATAPIAAEDANAPVTLSFNTAAFTASNGSVAFKNGNCTLKAKARLVGGTSTNSANTVALTLNNIDFVATSFTTAPSTGQNASATDATGLLWKAGSVTVTAIPVVYTAGRSVVSGSISLVNVSGQNAQGPGTAISAVGNGGTLTTLTGLTPSSGVISATFPNTTNLATAGAVGGVTDGSAVGGVGFLVTTVDNSGNVGPAANPTAANSVRLDNRAPDVTTIPPTFVPNTQNTTGGWVGTNFVFSTAAGSLTIDPLTATDAVFGIGVVGVDKNTVNTQWRPNGAGSSSFATFTNVSSLAETSNTTGSGSYDLRLQVCDALGNCSTTGTLTAFGVDLTPPFVQQVSGPSNLQVYNIGTGGPPAAVFNVADTSKTAGITASGPQTVGGIPQVLETLQSLKPSGASSSQTVCDVGVATGSAPSITCKSASLVSELAVPTTSGAGGTTSGEYTMTVTAVDQAGNTAAPISIKLYNDQVAPAVSGGVAIPQSITSGSSFTSGASDNMDVAAGNGYLNYPGVAVRIFEGGSSSPAGVTFDNVLTRTSTSSTIMTPFYRSLGNALNAIGGKPDIAGIRAIDAAGNLSVAQQVSLPPTNITAPSSAPFTNTSTVNGITSWGITAMTPNPVDSLANGNPKPVTLTATAQALNLTTASPFTSVCFYIASPTGTEGGVAGTNGSAAGELIQVGSCIGQEVTTIDGGGNRFLSYTTTWNPPKAFKGLNITVYAIGGNATADGLISAPAVLTINP